MRLRIGKARSRILRDALDLAPVDSADPNYDDRLVMAFRDYLKQHDQDELVVVDNIHNPAEVQQRPIAAGMTLEQLCQEVDARLLVTTRFHKLPNGFADISVNVLLPEDAREVLLDAWANSERKDVPDGAILDKIAGALGYLPLALMLATAALKKRPKLAPVTFLQYLRDKGIDQIADKFGVEKDGPSGYVARVDVALEWQVKQLEKAEIATSTGAVGGLR